MEKGTYSGIAAQTSSDTGLKTTMAANEAILGSVKEYGIKFSQLIEKEQEEDVRLQTIAREAVNRLAAAKADTSYSKFVSDMKDEYMGKLAEIESRRKGRAFDSKLQAEQNAVISQMNKTLSEIETSNGIAAAWSEGLKDYDPDLGKSQVLLADEFNEKMMKGVFVYRNGGVYDTEKQQQLGPVSDVMAYYHQPLPKNTNWLKKSQEVVTAALTEAEESKKSNIVGGKVVSTETSGFKTGSRQRAEMNLRQLWAVDDENGLSQQGLAGVKSFLNDKAGIQAVAAMTRPNDLISAEDIATARAIVKDEKLITKDMMPKIASLAAAHLTQSLIPTTTKYAEDIATKSQLGLDDESGKGRAAKMQAIENARGLYARFLTSDENAALDQEELAAKTGIKEAKVTSTWVRKMKVKQEDGSYVEDWVPAKSGDYGAVRGVHIDGKTSIAFQLRDGTMNVKDISASRYIPKTDPILTSAFRKTYAPNQEYASETALALDEVRSKLPGEKVQYKEFVDPNTKKVTRATETDTYGNVRYYLFRNGKKVEVSEKVFKSTPSK